MPSSEADEKSIACARWSDERSARTWGQYADDVARTEDRRAWERVIREVVGEEPKRVLDVGTGAGFLAGLYAGLGHDVVGCDISEPMLERARERADRDGFDARFTAGDAEDLPFVDRSFDVVTNRVMLWSLPNPGVAVREWYRVLRPGGVLVLFGNDPEDPTRPLPERVVRSLSEWSRRVRPGGSGMDLDDDTRRAWDETARDFPFSHAPPSKIRSLFAAAGCEETRVIDVAESVGEYRAVGPWRRLVPWHVVVGHKPA